MPARPVWMPRRADGPWTAPNTTFAPSLKMSQPGGSMYANPRVALSRTYGDWTAEAALDHRRVVQNQNVPPCGVSGAFLEQRASEQSDHKLNPQRFSKKNAIGGHPRFGVAEWG